MLPIFLFIQMLPCLHLINDYHAYICFFLVLSTYYLTYAPGVPGKTGLIYLIIIFTLNLVKFSFYCNMVGLMD